MDFVCAMSMYKVTWQLESSQQLLDAQHLVYRLNFAKAIRWGQHLSHGIVSKAPYFLEKDTKVMFRTWKLPFFFPASRPQALPQLQGHLHLWGGGRFLWSFVSFVWWQTPTWFPKYSCPFSKSLSIVLSRSLEAPLGMPQRGATRVAVN